jgi:hypothetical protein
MYLAAFHVLGGVAEQVPQDHAEHGTVARDVAIAERLDLDARGNLGIGGDELLHGSADSCRERRSRVGRRARSGAGEIENPVDHLAGPLERAARAVDDGLGLCIGVAVSDVAQAEGDDRHGAEQVVRYALGEVLELLRARGEKLRVLRRDRRETPVRADRQPGGDQGDDRARHVEADRHPHPSLAHAQDPRCRGGRLALVEVAELGHDLVESIDFGVGGLLALEVGERCEPAVELLQVRKQTRLEELALAGIPVGSAVRHQLGIERVALVDDALSRLPDLGARAGPHELVDVVAECPQVVVGAVEMLDARQRVGLQVVHFAIDACGRTLNDERRPQERQRHDGERRDELVQMSTLLEAKHDPPARRAKPEAPATDSQTEPSAVVRLPPHLSGQRGRGGFCQNRLEEIVPK